MISFLWIICFAGRDLAQRRDGSALKRNGNTLQGETAGLGATLIHPVALPRFAVAIKEYQIDGYRGNHEEDPIAPLQFRGSLLKIGFVFVRVVPSPVSAERTIGEVTRNNTKPLND